MIVVKCVAGAFMLWGGLVFAIRAAWGWEEDTAVSLAGKLAVAIILIVGWLWLWGILRVSMAVGP